MDHIPLYLADFVVLNWCRTFFRFRGKDLIIYIHHLEFEFFVYVLFVSTSSVNGIVVVADCVESTTCRRFEGETVTARMAVYAVHVV